MPNERPIETIEPEKDKLEDRERRLRRDRRTPDRWSGLFWGLALILLGVFLFAATRGWLSWSNWWQYFLMGLGAVFILDALVHFVSGDRGEAVGRIIPGVVLICVGVAFVYGWDQWWPLILIAAGVAVLVSLVLRRK